ncbi:MAG: hypothetical protein HY761_00415 [Candidatus Omnitrophica bacterium]|nr:hypothetical protein [Candidatus Omnitrophota bacterium]
MLSKKVEQDIKAVLDYLWHDEKRHYQESKYCSKHIFRTLVRLAKTIKYEH